MPPIQAIKGRIFERRDRITEGYARRKNVRPNRQRPDDKRNKNGNQGMFDKARQFVVDDGLHRYNNTRADGEQ